MWVRGGSKGGETKSDAGFTVKVEQTQLTGWIEGGGEGGQDCKVPVWNKPLCVELGKAACEACLARGVCDLLSPRAPSSVPTPGSSSQCQHGAQGRGLELKTGER